MHLWQATPRADGRSRSLPGPQNACVASTQVLPRSNYSAATLLDCLAKSRSITERQPLERLARFFTMQAVTFEMLGISELQRRNASPVHICWASALKAKLEVDETADKEAA